MPADAILVIDAGTSGLRALCVSVSGNVQVVAREPWPTFVPEDATPFGREFHPAAVSGALGRLMAAAEGHRERIVGIAVTGQREGMTFTDGRGDAVFASPNIDARAAAEGIAIDAAFAAEVYAATGHLPSLMQVPAKLAWLRAHRPAIAEHVRHALPLVDWIAALLTGRPAISRSLAAENGLLDISTGVAPGDLFDRLGFPAAIAVDVVPDGAVSGEVGAGAFAGLPVVLAGADTQCALVGMGAIDPGAVGVPVGWTAPVQMVTDRAVFDADRRTWTSVHVVSGRWILESNAGEAGRAWEWICSMMSLTPADGMALAASTPAGSRDAMAVLGARAMRAAELNAGAGALTMPLPLVMSAPDRGDVLRSVVEATAYSIRANLEQLEAIAGVGSQRLRVGGGLSQSGAFAQLIADVIDRPVERGRSSASSAAGAAALAFVALGLEPSLAAAVDSVARGGVTLEPAMAASLVYEDCYARWCALSDELARIGGGA